MDKYKNVHICITYALHNTATEASTTHTLQVICWTFFANSQHVGGYDALHKDYINIYEALFEYQAKLIFQLEPYMNFCLKMVDPRPLIQSESYYFNLN